MNMFICRTIFQVYYANIIIQKKALKDIFFIYLTDGFSERERYVLNELNVDYIVISGGNQLSRLCKQIKLLRLISKRIRSESGHSDLYFASIDDPFIQTIISRHSFSSIFTFDDGTANYVRNSLFYIDQKLSFPVKIKYLFLGNKINNLNQVKTLIKTHYSSNKLPNIVKNVETISLIDFSEFQSIQNVNNEINVYLCPYFDEIYVDHSSVRFKFISKLGTQDIVIPHPRDKFNWKKYDHFRISNDTVAEKIIIDLICKGHNINLYGVANSTQYHFSAVDLVNNKILMLGEVKPTYLDSMDTQVKIFYQILGRDSNE